MRMNLQTFGNCPTCRCSSSTTVVLLFLQKRPKLGPEYLVMSLLVAFATFCLVQRPAPTDVFSWDVQPSVLVSFCQAIVTVKLPYEQIFTKPGKAWLHNNVIMWQIDTDKFPGPAASALGTGQSAYRWWHGCSEASLLGIFKSGRVFRTCNETATDTAFGFFGRAAYDGDDMYFAGITSKLALYENLMMNNGALNGMSCSH